MQYLAHDSPVLDKDETLLEVVCRITDLTLTRRLTGLSFYITKHGACCGVLT